MGTVQFYDSVVLFGDSAGDNTDKIAFHEDCCCGEECGFCTELPARQYQVTVGGILELDPEDCGDCLSLNDQYIVTQGIKIENEECSWTYTFDPTVCQVLTVRFYLAINAGPDLDKTGIEAYLHTGSGYLARFFLEWDGDPDCIDFSNMNIPLYWYATAGVGATCSFAGATFRIDGAV